MVHLPTREAFFELPELLRYRSWRKDVDLSRANFAGATLRDDFFWGE